MKDPQHSVLASPVAGIRTLLDETADEERLWSDEDLRDVLAHQWSAPLGIDLAGLDEGTAGDVALAAMSGGQTLRSFEDLLEHPDPPLELLELAKEFAKRCLGSPHSAIPQDVARVMYFAGIAAALGHCGRRITSLSDESIANGIRWALAKDWLAQGPRNVLLLGLDALEGKGSPGDERDLPEL